MMANSQSNFNQYFKAFRILHLALCAAVLAFGLMVQFVLLPMPDFQPEGNSSLFINIAGVYLVFAIAIGYWLFGSQLKLAKTYDSLNNKLHTYRSASIVRFALLEGSILMALVFYLLTANPILIAIAGIGFILLLMLHPNAMKLKNDLELSQPDLDRLENSDELVVQSSLIKRF